MASSARHTVKARRTQGRRFAAQVVYTPVVLTRFITPVTTVRAAARFLSV
jgi:hypothetical protein